MVLASPLPRMLELTVAAVRSAPRVLEVASGAGPVTAALAPRVGELVTADVSALPDDEHRFDAIVAANVLHLILDLYGALRALKRVLRPGGRLVCPTFCHDETLTARLASRATRFPGKRRYSSASLQETLRVCGVKVEYAETIPGLVPICFVDAVYF